LPRVCIDEAAVGIAGFLVAQPFMTPSETVERLGGNCGVIAVLFDNLPVQDDGGLEIAVDFFFFDSRAQQNSGISGLLSAACD
jgi:hypothetical protein